MAKKTPIVRAADVGFGLVKHNLRASADGTELAYTHFPSMAIPSDPNANAILGARQRNTFNIPTSDGMLFEVGHEVLLAQTGNDYGRSITDEFLHSSIYEALGKGALRYMHEAGDTEIDVLVLGLPVNQYLDSNRRAQLQQLFTGEHALGDDKKIVVHSVLVQAQPMGGYIDLPSHLAELNACIKATGGALQPLASGEDLDRLSVLIVDPGEHTLDWLLLQRGSLTSKASGATSDSGRHRVVRAVYEALEAKLGRPLGAAAMPRINDALRLDEPLRLQGEDHDLKEFEPVIRAAVADPVNRLVDGLRGMQEFVDLVVVVGGHPTRYQAELSSRFPKVPIFVSPASLMANVKGFQTIGEAIAAQSNAA